MTATDTFPTITHITEKRVHARFSHTCSLCGHVIQRGELHTYFVFTDNDALHAKLRTSRIHLHCPQ